MICLKHFKCDGVFYCCGDEYEGPSGRVDELKSKKLLGNQSQLDEINSKATVPRLQLAANRKREKDLTETHETQRKLEIAGGKKVKPAKPEAVKPAKPAKKVRGKRAS